MNAIAKLPRARRARVAMVLTRDIDEDVGRVKTMREVSQALAEVFSVERFRLHNLLESRRFSDFVYAGLVWLQSLLMQRPMALQCLLFATNSDCRKIICQIENGGFDAVYVDMVRSQYILRCLRRAMPSIRVVTDLDDLISRRLKLRVASGAPFAMGFVGRNLPSFLRPLAQLIPSRLIQQHEYAGVRRAELEMAAASDAVVFVSSIERDLMREALPASGRPRVEAIVPPAEVRAPAGLPHASLRFLFIGSDSYHPNRVAIDFLLEQWRILSPKTELHIYGRQTRKLPEVPGVVWGGFIRELPDAYVPGSIALAPLPLPGGIKTKVIEAWSFGCPVLGTPESFEGLCGNEYPLALPLSRWTDYLVNPSAHEDAWLTSAKIGQSIVAERLSPARFRVAWQMLFAG